MKKKLLTFHQLIEKNKEEMMKNESAIEEIEKRLEEKQAAATK